MNCLIYWFSMFFFPLLGRRPRTYPKFWDVFWTGPDGTGRSSSLPLRPPWNSLATIPLEPAWIPLWTPPHLGASFGYYGFRINDFIRKKSADIFLSEWDFLDPQTQLPPRGIRSLSELRCSGSEAIPALENSEYNESQ